jgi:hypothetical protein
LTKQLGMICAGGFLEHLPAQMVPYIKVIPGFEISLRPGGFQLLCRQAARFSYRCHRRERRLAGPALIVGAAPGLWRPLR